MPTIEDDEKELEKLRFQVSLCLAELKRAERMIIRRAKAKKFGIRNPLLQKLERKKYVTALKRTIKYSRMLAAAEEDAGKPEHRRKRRK